MTVNILTGFEKINEIIKECITREITTDGLLEDVETFVNTYYEEGSIDEPVIWITQNDIEDANMQSQNLANRVILSVLRNWQTVQAETLPGQRMIKNITLNRYSPLGYVNVKGKSDRVPVTGVVLDVNHIVNWSLCCKQLNNNGE